MAAKKDGKSNKTNKTAHVLSLLTDPEEAKTADAQQDEAVSAEVPAPAAAAAPAVLEAQRANDDAIAGKIKDGLSRELELELAAEFDGAPAEEPSQAAEPAPAPPAEPETAPAPEPVPAAAPTPEPAPVTEPAPVPAAEPASVTKPEPAPEAAPAFAPDLMEETPLPAVKGITCMNVMQALVKEKADKYIKKFGLCDCPRCRIDVMALALTNLPAKYVVVREADAIPMLTVYEGRYNTAVISQVMWACKTVMDNPRH